jgi:hypothetical protein
MHRDAATSGPLAPVVCKPLLTARRFDLDATNRHQTCRRRCRQLRAWLRSLVVVRVGWPI